MIEQYTDVTENTQKKLKFKAQIFSSNLDFAITILLGYPLHTMQVD